MNPIKKNIDKTKFKKVLVEYSLMIIILFFVTSSLIQGSRVPTGSMETTVLPGDWTMINKLAYNLTTLSF